MSEKLAAFQCLFPIQKASYYKRYEQEIGKKPLVQGNPTPSFIEWAWVEITNDWLDIDYLEYELYCDMNK